MIAIRRAAYLVGFLAVAALSSPAWSIDEAGVKALAANMVLQLPPTADGPAKITVKSVATFSSGGSVWYMVTGSDAGADEVLFLDFTGPAAHADLVVKDVTMTDLKLKGPRQLENFEAQGKGRLSFGGRDYIFESADDAVYSDGQARDEVSYYEFSNPKDDSDGLLIIQWDDNDLDGFLTKSIDVKAIKLL
jgi:hypothetical protein